MAKVEWLDGTTRILEQQKAAALAKESARRGLDLAKLGCYAASARELDDIMGHPLPGGMYLVIPYHDIHGAPIISKRGYPYVRVRALYPNPKVKYFSPRGKEIHLYLTPGLDWAEIAADPTIPLLNTEGEFKGAVVCSTEDWPACIALGGVNSWNAPELADFVMVGRTFYNCYDSDIVTKVEVQRAQSSLVSHISKLGAEMSIVHLAQVTQEKGVDDYIVNARGSWMALEITATKAEPSLLSEMLGDYAMMHGGLFVLELATGKLMKENGFHKHTAPIRMMGGTAEKPRMVPVSTLWSIHKDRIIVDEIVMDPTKEFGLVGSNFNLWRGYVREPVKTELYDGVVEHWEHFCLVLLGSLAPLWHQWTAWWIRNPSVRNYTSWILKSRHEGIGKSLLGEIVARMVGDRKGEAARVVMPEALFSNFPDFGEGTVYIVANEVSDDRARHKNLMKALRTNDKVRVERKGIQGYEVDNHINYVLSTNSAYVYEMSSTSRRDIVVEVNADLVESKVKAWSLFVNDTIADFMRSPEALGNLLWYYMNEVDLTNYNPRADAPVTDAKIEMSRAAEGGNAILRDVAMELVERFGGKGVIVSSELRKFLAEESFAENDSRWMTFNRLIGEVAGTMATGNEKVVKFEGSAKVCLIFGEDNKVMASLDKQAEIRRGRDVLKEWLKVR